LWNAEFTTKQAGVKADARCSEEQRVIEFIASRRHCQSITTPLFPLSGRRRRLRQLTALVGFEDAWINHVDASKPTASTSFDVDRQQETGVKNVS
jgi:hypothetical protein